MWFSGKAEELYLRSIRIGRKLFGPSYSGLEYDYRGLIQVAHSSVADPGCLSRIRIFSHPGSRISKNMGRYKKNFLNLFSHLFVAFRSC